MKTVYVLGSINMDLVMQASRMPEDGETLVGEKFLMVPGGKGANQAVASARQNVSTVMLGAVGTDAFGERLLSSLRASGVDCIHVEEIADCHSGIASIWVVDGENRIIIDAGANGALSERDILDVIENKTHTDDILVAQLEIPLQTVMKAFEAAKKKGLTTILNPAPAQKLDEHLYPLVDIMILNETEAALLTGIFPKGSASSEEAAERITRKGVGEVVLTLGKKGVGYFDKNTSISLKAHEVRTVDTTAAGDTFIGVFSAAMTYETNRKKALIRANAAAALSTQKLGAQGSIPFAEEVTRFLEKDEGR